jgi:transcriptional regulator with XRE-family HTH domain
MLSAEDENPGEHGYVVTATQREVFRRALRLARVDDGLSQRALARAVDVSPGAVWQWERDEDGTIPRLDMTTRLEQILKLEPGHLSRLLGYVPATAEPGTMTSVVAAARADPRLGDSERELLIAVYRELVRQSASKRSKPSRRS